MEGADLKQTFGSCDGVKMAPITFGAKPRCKDRYGKDLAQKWKKFSKKRE